MNTRHQPQREAVLEDCDIAWLWKVHADAQSKGLHADQRKIERILAALTTPAPAVKPHCSTCGKDVAEVLCETCGKWWADNAPPAPAVSTDDAIEQIVVGFSDKAILRLDIEEDDPRLSRVCDDMRQTVRAILSRLRGEG